MPDFLPRFEAEPIIGGGARSAELTLPGFVHDICSVVHPFALGSPAFVGFALCRFGLEWLSQPVFRPTSMLYRTPLEGVYLCSSSTPPGGGVHGMCGFHAAQLALRETAGHTENERPG